MLVYKIILLTALTTYILNVYHVLTGVQISDQEAGLSCRGVGLSGLCPVFSGAL